MLFPIESKAELILQIAPILTKTAQIISFATLLFTTISMLNTKYNVLIIDEDVSFSSTLKEHLEQESFQVKTISDPYLAMPTAHDFKPDLFVLEINIPGLDGFQICRILRAVKEFSLTPIFFVSSDNNVEHRVKAFEYGCDSFFNKPINMRELTLAIKAVLKRVGFAEDIHSESTLLQAGSLKFDEKKRLVSVNNKPIELTPIQYRLLHCLIKDKGNIQTRDHLRTKIWPHLNPAESRAIDVHIRRLREKLAEDGNLIETIRGVGYRVTD